MPLKEKLDEGEVGRDRGGTSLHSFSRETRVLVGRSREGEKYPGKSPIGLNPFAVMYEINSSVVKVREALLVKT
jgi:hypothetical protein